MDTKAIVWALQQLRPGAAWNISEDVITQAADGTPRVSIPTVDEIKAVIGNYIKPLTVEERIQNLENNVSAVALKTGTVLNNVPMQ